MNMHTGAKPIDRRMVPAMRSAAAASLCAAGMLFAAPASAQILDCNSIDALSGVQPYAPTAAGARCREWSGASGSTKIYYPADWGAEPAADRAATLRSIDDAVARSVDVYATLGFLSGAAVRPVHVGYAMSRPRGDDAEAITNYSTPVRHCDMLVYDAAARTMTEDQLKQLVAHEVFHCVQIYAFPQRYTPAAYWWQEGSAEMASGLVYPSTNMEHGHTGAFRQDRILFDHDYPTALFFQDYANQRGIPALIALLRRMPDTDDPRVQYETLSALAGFNDIFHEFGRHYIDRAIADPGGGTMAQPEPGARAEHVISESGATTLTTTTFIIDAYILRLEKGKRFRLTGLGPRGDDVAISWRFAGDAGAWTRAGPEDEIAVETDCDNDRRIFVLLTSTRNSAEFIDFEIDAEVEEIECESCECAGPVPACVVGAWRMHDISQWDPYWERITRMMEGRAAFTQERGEVDFTVTRDGRFSDSLAVQSSARMVDSPVMMRTAISGIGSGSICRTADDRLCRDYAESSLLLRTGIYNEGALVSDQSTALPPNDVVISPYECRGSRLMIEGTYPFDPPLTLQFEFQR